jgi:hypothetical protein
VYFILENSLNSVGNSYLISPKVISNNLSTYIQSSNDEILVFALSIPNTVILNNQKINISLTTLLTTSLKYRNIGLAAYLIRSLIDHGYYHNIPTGYHFISHPRNVSNISCQDYYRPLDIELAKEMGYQIPSLNYEVRPGSDYSIRATIFNDILILQSKNTFKLNLSLTDKEFDDLCKNVFCYTILCKNKIVGIVMYKSVLIHIHKVKKLCPIARMVYFETLSKHRQHTLAKSIQHISEQNKYAVISGVCLGELSDEFMQKKYGLVISGQVYLDFYNIYIKPENCNPKNINVLYL